MKSQLKRFVGASLLTLLFTSQVGYYFVYTIHQFIIKEEMERELLTQIPESSFELIVAEEVAGKIEWEEKGKEFYLDGEMYDFRRPIEKDGAIEIVTPDSSDALEVLRHSTAASPLIIRVKKCAARNQPHC